MAATRTRSGIGRGQIDVAPFNDLIDSIEKNYRSTPTGLKKVIAISAALVLSRTANNIGVAYKKGKFSKKVSVGRKYLKRRYTWKRATTRGVNKGKPPKQGVDSAPAIGVNGRKVSRDSYAKYKQAGRIARVDLKLAYLRQISQARVGSSKASFYIMAKKAGLKTVGFKEKGDLAAAARSAGYTFSSASRTAKIDVIGRHGYQIDSKAFNSLNPKVRGIAVFQKSVNGLKRQFGVLVRKGYINSFEDIARELQGVQVTASGTRGIS